MFLNRFILTASVASLVVLGSTVSLSQIASAQTATPPANIAPSGTTMKVKHPHIRAALQTLRQARKQLILETDSNFSSADRTKAIADIDTVINELKAALAK